MAQAASNIFWLTFSRVSALVLLFFAYSQLFRYLGPFGSGQHQFILSYSTIFAVIIDFGISQYVIKKISQDPANVKKYFQSFFVAETFLSTLVYLVMVGIAYFANYEPPVFWGIVVAGAGLAVTGLVAPFLSVLSAFQDLKRVAFINFLSSLINITFIFLTIYTGQYVTFLVANQIVYALISLVVYFFYIQKYIGKTDLFRTFRDVEWVFTKKILIAALPFALLVGFSTLYNRIDIVLITKLLGYQATGLYTAAYKFFDLITFFPAVVSHALFPLFTSLLSENNLVGAEVTFQKYFKFMLALALPMGVAGTLLSRQIIAIIAGPEFEASAQVLSVLIWAPVILFIYIVANSIVISQLTKFAVAITSVNVIVNVVGNLILLPRVGIIGAAIMTVASEAVQGIFYFYFLQKKIFKIRLDPSLLKPILASLVMGLCLWPITHMNLLIAGLVASLSYAGTLLLLGFFKTEDLQFIKKLLFKPKL